MNTEPTLCLVMDGEKIVSYDIHHGLTPSTVESIAKNHGLLILTIPLRLCALAPEMKETLKSIASYGYDTVKNEQTGLCPYGCDTPNIARSLLSRIS